MSLERFGFVKTKRGNSDCSAKEEPCTKLKKDEVYDREKRSRQFLPSWKGEFTWLEFRDGRMFCKVCRLYPAIAMSALGKDSFIDGGSTSFHKGTLKSHHGSRCHTQCVRLFLKHGHEDDSGNLETKEELDPKQRQLPAVLTTLTDKQFSGMKYLFRTCFYVAKKARPFSDIVELCELQELNGVELPDNYRNGKMAATFVSSIAAVMVDEAKRKLRGAKFVSVLSDGSTDAGVVEQETVQVRLFDRETGKVITVQADHVALDSADGEGVMCGIVKALSTLGLDMKGLRDGNPKLICANFDGASVMQSLSVGCVGRIQREIPWIVPMHCVAHKLELSVLDAVKEENLTSFEDTIKGIFKFYYYSPKRLRQLKEMAEVLEVDLAHMGSLKQVRWLASRTRALRAVIANLEAIVSHLEHFSSTEKGPHGNTAKGHLRHIKTVCFIKTLYFMADLLPKLASVSKIFQREDLLVSEVIPELEDAVLQLTAMKTTPDINMEFFLLHYKPDDRKFRSISLLGVCGPVHYSSDQLLRLVDSCTKYIDKRFEIFRKQPLKCLNVFDFAYWPSDRASLAAYGREDIQGILDHFHDIFPKDTHRLYHQQFVSLKGHLLGTGQGKLASPFETYSTLLLTRPEKFTHILDLVELLFVMSPSTASCERAFSKQNLVKTKLRTSLGQENLSSLIRVMQNTDSLSSFDPEPAIHHFLTSGPGTRHVRGHKVAASQSAVDHEELGADSVTVTNPDINFLSKRY